MRAGKGPEGEEQDEVEGRRYGQGGSCQVGGSLIGGGLSAPGHPLPWTLSCLHRAFVSVSVSRCRPCCLFSSENIKWPRVSVSGGPTHPCVCVVQDSGLLYLSQLHRQL